MVERLKQRFAVEDGLGVAAVVASWLYGVVKAWRLVFTCDEAYCYLDVTRHSFGRIFSQYAPHNHVLNTVLSKGMALLFGPSEFVLRTPALLGRAFFLLAVVVLAHRCLANARLRLVCILFLAFQPFLLDMGILHRGYSLGLGFSMLGVGLAFRTLGRIGRVAEHPFRSPELHGLSVLLGLAMASVPVFATVFLSVFALVLWRVVRERRFSWRRFVSAAFALGSGATLLVVLFYSGFLGSMSRAHFYAGSLDAWASYLSLYRPVFAYDHSPLHDPISWFSARFASFFLHPAVAVGFLVGCLAIVFAGLSVNASPPFVDFLLLYGGMLLVIAVLGFGFRLPFPADRTGLFLIPPFVFLFFMGFERLLAWGVARATRPVARRLLSFVVGVACLLILATQFVHLHIDRCALWHRNEAARAAVRHLRKHERPASLPTSPPTLGVTWWLRYPVEYYRLRYNVDWIAPTLPFLTEERDGTMDYYILADEPMWGDFPSTRTLLVHFPDTRYGLYRGSPRSGESDDDALSPKPNPSDGKR